MTSNPTFQRRFRRIALIVATATAASPMLASSASAQQNPSERNSRESQEVCPCRLRVERDLIRYEVSYLLGFQLRNTISKDGKEIGPKLFTIVPEDALDGSSDSVKHLRHARQFHWATLTSGLIAMGLLSSAAIVRFDEKRWSSSAEYLAGGGVAALFLGALLGYNRQEELMAAIDAYNHDVLNRK